MEVTPGARKALFDMVRKRSVPGPSLNGVAALQLQAA
jgi:hypothetical protein